MALLKKDDMQKYIAGSSVLEMKKSVLEETVGKTMSVNFQLGTDEEDVRRITLRGEGNSLRVSPTQFFTNLTGFDEEIDTESCSVLVEKIIPYQGQGTHILSAYVEEEQGKYREAIAEHGKVLREELEEAKDDANKRQDAILAFAGNASAARIKFLKTLKKEAKEKDEEYRRYTLMLKLA